jgi:hypothetical protein
MCTSGITAGLPSSFCFEEKKEKIAYCLREITTNILMYFFLEFVSFTKDIGEPRKTLKGLTLLLLKGFLYGEMENLCATEGSVLKE